VYCGEISGEQWLSIKWIAYRANRKSVKSKMCGKRFKIFILEISLHIHLSLKFRFKKAKGALLVRPDFARFYVLA